LELVTKAFVQKGACSPHIRVAKKSRDGEVVVTTVPLQFHKKLTGRVSSAQHPAECLITGLIDAGASSQSSPLE
jgi:hypothetical protein